MQFNETGKKITLKTSNMSIKAVNRHGGGGGETWEQFSVNYDGDVLYDPARLPSRRKKRGDRGVETKATLISTLRLCGPLMLDLCTPLRCNGGKMRVGGGGCRK